MAQLIESGNYVHNLMFPPHFPVTENGIFNSQKGNSNQNFLRIELLGPWSGLRDKLGSLGPYHDHLATSEDFGGIEPQMFGKNI